MVELLLHDFSLIYSGDDQHVSLASSQLHKAVSPDLECHLRPNLSSEDKDDCKSIIGQWCSVVCDSVQF